jgi:hypothetical protein
VDFAFALPSEMIVVWVVVAFIIGVVIHVAFALAVNQDAKKQRTTVLVHGGIWTLATLLGGVFVAAIYWTLHHSTLFAPSQESTHP